MPDRCSEPRMGHPETILGALTSTRPFFDENYLILSTIHSAKDQESSAVFKLNVVDECAPLRTCRRAARRRSTKSDAFSISR